MGEAQRLEVGDGEAVAVCEDASDREGVWDDRVGEKETVWEPLAVEVSVGRVEAEGVNVGRTAWQGSSTGTEE